jgi:hypothetical protein
MELTLPREFRPEYGAHFIKRQRENRLPKEYLPPYNLGAFGLDSSIQELQLCGYTEARLAAISFFKGLYREVVINDKSFLGGFEGPHRVGKSTDASWFGFLLDRTFWEYYQERLVIEPIDIMKAITNIEKHKIHGAVIQIEEAGIGMASADRYETAQKVLEKTIQAIGWLNPILIFIAPMSTFINAKARKMFHMTFDIRRYDRISNRVYPRELYMIKTKSGVVFGRKCPVLNYMGERKQLTDILVSKPPPFIIERYEELAGQRKPELLKKLSSDLQAAQRQSMKETRDINTVISGVVEMTKKNTFLSRLERDIDFEADDSLPDRIKLNKVAIRFGMGIASEEASHVQHEAERRLWKWSKENKEIIKEWIKNAGGKNDNDKGNVDADAVRGENPA